MKRWIGYLIIGMGFSAACSESNELTGDRLLEKSIEYHDPEGNWDSFSASLHLTTQAPDKPTQNTRIDIRNEEDYFAVYQEVEGVPIYKGIQKDSCFARVNNSSPASEDQVKKYGLSCDDIKWARDFYTYLYGLPMKLKDPGTIVHKEVKDTTFNDQPYKVLKVNYEEEVGSDVWYFLFHPETYALKAYKFYHDESKNNGEFISLEEEELVQGIKIPKVRNWYWNENEDFIATDILTKGERMP